MKISQWTSLNIALGLLCLVHLSGARLDFWNSHSTHGSDNEKRANDLNPNKLSPVIFSEYHIRQKFAFFVVKPTCIYRVNSLL